MKPVGWTRQSNVDGFIVGTYDVINFWRRGPEVENMSDVAVCLELADGLIQIGWASNYDKYAGLVDDVIACWPKPRNEQSIPLYIKEQ